MFSTLNPEVNLSLIVNVHGASEYSCELDITMFIFMDKETKLREFK